MTLSQVQQGRTRRVHKRQTGEEVLGDQDRSFNGDDYYREVHRQPGDAICLCSDHPGDLPGLHLPGKRTAILSRWTTAGTDTGAFGAH
jgi:hypothetical protein